MSKKRLNIAIVTNNYTPYSGGVVSSIDSFVNELHKQGHKAFIITLDFLGAEHKDPYYVIRIPSTYRFMYKNNHMGIPTSKTKKLEHIIQMLNPDIIHTQHPFFICNAALKIAKKLNIPTVFTYHTIYERYLHYIPVPQFISKPIVKKMVLSFCKKVDRIIVPSSYIKNYLEKNNIETKTEKIPSGILPIFIKDKLCNIQKQGFNLILVSRFVKEKNIEFLLRLFAKLIKKYPEKNFAFTLIGYGNEYENIKKYAYKKLKLKNSVTFIHRPQKQTIADLYLQSDLFLFSSTSDTQGLVLAEAMGCGCPVVSLDGPGQRDIIKNGQNGFLCNTE
ncbi:glycosyltransferase, partial [Candidatus Dependentiae bacterium]